MMEKTYKSESRAIKRIAISTRLTFRQRKIILDIMPLIIGFFMLSMTFEMSNILATNNKPLIWMIFSIISIPMYLIFLFLAGTITKFDTLEEYVENEIRKYLKNHSWRNIYMLIKKHRFPIIIEDALLKIMFRKINRMKSNSEIKAWIVKEDYLLLDESTGRFKLKDRK